MVEITAKDARRRVKHRRWALGEDLINHKIDDAIRDCKSNFIITYQYLTPEHLINLELRGFIVTEINADEVKVSW
jgi:hypothetical protein